MKVFALLAGVGALAMATQSYADYQPGSLIAHWRMNETNTSETTVADNSGNNNDGTRREGTSLTITTPEVVISGPQVITAGPTVNSITKNAVRFDAGNDMLRIADSTDLQFNKQKGTISVWLKMVNDAQRHAILRSGSSINNGVALEQTGSGGAYRVFFHPNAASSSALFMCTAAPNYGNWQHYVFVWDLTAADSGVPASPNRVKAWVNGVAQANYTTGGGTGDSTFTSTATTTDWVWGQRHQETFASGLRRPFGGDMAEIAIYNTNLSDSEAAALYNGVDTANPNLIAYHDFSEGPGGGTQIADSSGLNNDVMYLSEITPNFPIGGPTWVSAAATGKPSYITRALSFDGTNDCVVIPRSASLAFDKNQGSIVLWVYADTTLTGRAGIVSDSQSRLSSEYFSSSSIFFQPNGGTSLYNSGGPGGARTLGTWQHVAFVWDTSQPNGATTAAPNKRKMYLNGALVANSGTAAVGDAGYTTGPITEDWTIGRRGILEDTANARWFKGQMADVAIFNVPISAADIAQIASTTTGGGVPAFLLTSVDDWSLLED